MTISAGASLGQLGLNGVPPQLNPRWSMPDSLPTQTEIIAALMADREEALAVFFSAVQPRLKKIVHFRLDYRLGGRVSESDVIQEAYLRAAQRLDQYLEKDKSDAMPFFVWLRLEISQKLQEIHRYHFAAERRDVRKEMRLQQITPDAGQTSLALAAHLVSQIASPSRQLRRAEQIAQLEKNLNEMNELDREVIALRHFEELSNIETAEILSIEPAAASKRYLRALKRLREIMRAVPDIGENCF
jgi:RNA polymerase sigma-70 factor (ECF subfamily)